MTGNSFIRNLSGVALLLVFALSITPKQLLHDAIANHKHQPVQKAGEVHVEKSGFICNCADQVAESPFIPSILTTEVPLSFIYGEAYDQFSSSVLSETRIDFQLRGPPAIG